MLDKKPYKTSFRAAWWLSNRHAQTIWAAIFRRPTPFKKKWERVELPDNDFIDLVWNADNAGDFSKPIVLILHGLGGGIKSPYTTGLMHALSLHGWRPVLMHFRGCSGIPNRLPRAYHSGGTDDLAFIFDKIKKNNPGAIIAAVGISLGGNAMLKWVGETGSSNPLSAACGISIPFSLETCATELARGFPRLYQWSFLNHLKREIRKKFQIIPCPFDIHILDNIKDFWEFDDKITAPLHGFSNVHEYYRLAGCKPYLKKIAIPTLIIHAKDDPFMTPKAIPTASELSSSIKLELTEKGGHAAFIAGNIPFFPHYWLEECIPAFLSAFKK